MTAAAQSISTADLDQEIITLRLLVKADPGDLETRKRLQAAERASRERPFRATYATLYPDPHPVIADARRRGVAPSRVARGMLSSAKVRERASKGADRVTKPPKRTKSLRSAPTIAPAPPPVREERPVASPESTGRGARAAQAALRVALDALTARTDASRAQLALAQTRCVELETEVRELEIASNRLADLLDEPPPFMRPTLFRASLRPEGRH